MIHPSSEHYKNAKGIEYFDYQQKSAPGARLEARKFAPFIIPSDRVLDFGCGGGWILRQLNCAYGVGVEVNQAARALCKRNGVTVFASLGEIKVGEFDVAISNHCLEHVPRPLDELRGICRLVRSGGRLVLVLPIDDWRVQRDFTGRDIDHHLYTWTPRLLANILREAGFEVENIEVLTYAWFPGWEKLIGKLPQLAFDFLCLIAAIFKRRRQLRAVCRKSSGLLT